MALSKEVELKIEEIEKERAKYKPSMTFDEIVEMQRKYDAERGNPPLKLEQINQYIDEVRAMMERVDCK